MKKGKNRPIYSKNSGAILLMVLGLLMVLSLLVTHFLKEVLTDVHYRSQVYGDPELKTYAYEGLEISLAVLEEINTIYSGLFSPEQGWGNPLAYANIRFPQDIQARITITDETGKISLQNPDKRCFEAFCESIGISYADTSSLSQPLINWAKRKGTPATLEKLDLKTINAKQIDDAQKNLPDNPKNSKNDSQTQGPKPYIFSTQLKAYGDLQNFSHFREIFWNNSSSSRKKLLERFVAGTSFYNSFPININTANNDVLEALGKIYSLNIEDIKNFLKGDLSGSNKRHYYNSLEMLNRLGHGRLKITKDSQPKPAPRTSPDLSKKKHDKGDSKDNNSQALAIAPLGIDVRCQILRVQIETQKGDVRFTLTAIVKVNRPPSGNETKIKKQPTKTKSSKPDKDLTSQENTRYTNATRSGSIKIMGLTENGQIDW